MTACDVFILGAGAAGMMCAIEAGKRGRSVIIIDHAKAPGEKIRISGGGRCNFTNLHAGPENFLSANPHFAKSALKRYTQFDFINMVDRHGIAWHEKTLGQLFCDNSARDIIAMLRREMKQAGVDLRLETALTAYERGSDGWRLTLSDGREISAASIVIACGGKSIPKMGATGFAYEIAERFGLGIVETRPALVPLTFDPSAMNGFKPLAGVSVTIRARAGCASFDEAMLFTHRGLSGPAILQISSYWREGEEIEIELCPELDKFDLLRAARSEQGRRSMQTALSDFLPKRLAQFSAERLNLSGNLADQSDKALRALDGELTHWRLKPTGSEGYRTAEVTLGGIDTADLDSRTMSARNVDDLYFIGEAVDVTGWLGGYNFQWAWSSGWCAGQVV